MNKEENVPEAGRKVVVGVDTGSSVQNSIFTK